MYKFNLRLFAFLHKIAFICIEFHEPGIADS